MYSRTRMHTQTQLACANVHTRVQNCMRFNTSSPLKHTPFHLSPALAHTCATDTYVSPATRCMLMLIISQGRLMTHLSARQARQIQVRHRPPTHSDTMHGDRILHRGLQSLPLQLRKPSRNRVSIREQQDRRREPE